MSARMPARIEIGQIFTNERGGRYEIVKVTPKRIGYAGDRWIAGIRYVTRPSFHATLIAGDYQLAPAATP